MEFIIFILLIYFAWKFFKRRAINNNVKIKIEKNGKTITEKRKIRSSQKTLKIEKPQNFEFNPENKKVLEILENTSKNVFLTGKAGTGKSTLLKYFRATTNKSLAVVAPTGVAALNVQGQTIHSFFGFGIDITPEKVRAVRGERAKIFENLDMLIIDEVSMVRADLFECINIALQKNIGNELPFGGIQLVLIGDLYQLPPVVPNTEKKIFKNLYSSSFFFGSHSFPNVSFEKIELQKIYRQEDVDFIDSLNAIRTGDHKNKHLKLINSRVTKEEIEGAITLVPTNRLANSINQKHLNDLEGDSQEYTALIRGDFKESDYPTQEVLELKTDAQVMLLNNDKSSRWVNGDIVSILELKTNSVIVEFDDKTVADIEAYEWDKVKFIYNEEEKRVTPVKTGSFIQLPLKLAWAVTIHKSQGQSYNKMVLDMGSGAFAEGQTYVALSRARSLDGLYLRCEILDDDILVCDDVREFMGLKLSEKSEQKTNLEIDIKIKRNNLDGYKEYILKEIKKRREDNFKGIHVVYSGFNKDFREKFNDDPIKIVDQLVDEGILRKQLAKGGVIIYDANE